MPVSHKLKSNLANFRKFKCCCEFFMKIKVKISKNLKIGDIGSIFSVKKVDNGMKPVVYHKNRIISSF